jgi:hypothetical protein
MLLSFACPSSVDISSSSPKEEAECYFDEIQIQGYSHEIESEFLEKHTKQTLIQFFGTSQIKEGFSIEPEDLPLAKAIFPTKIPNTLQIALLCEGSHHTCGAGRHMIDTLSQWLIPGHPLMVLGILGVNFVFSARPNQKLFFCQLMLHIESKQELLRAQEGIHDLIDALKRSIAVVAYIRKLLSKNALTTFQQSALFFNFLHTYQNCNDLDFDSSLHDHAFELFRNALAEKKIEEARQNLEWHLTNRRAFFDRDIFSEIQYFTWLYRARFIGKKDSVLVTKLIGLQYLFRKYLKQKISENPASRHVTLKIFPIRRSLSPHTTSLGLLVGLNLIKEGEVFEDKHVLKAVERLVADIRLVSGSFIQDGRDTQKIRLFYLEIEKDDEKSFSSQELSLLRKQLGKELKACVETLIHPLFMPRNDEDLLRFSLQLCGQLVDISAPPQMAIFFGNQTSDTLSFNVILARVIDSHPTSSLVKELMHSGIFFEIADVEVRRPPFSEKLWKKEVISFNAKIPKGPFLRADYTIDVLQARQEIVRQIQEALGFVRDYNGGLLETQLRAEQLFIASLGDVGKRGILLAKAFFHAITPPLMQIILETSLLKKLYGMFLELYQNGTSLFSHSSTKRYELIFLKNSLASFKKEAQMIVQELDIPPSQITYVDFKQGEEYFFALIHQNEGLSHPLLLSRFLP